MREKQGDAYGICVPSQEFKDYRFRGSIYIYTLSTAGDFYPFFINSFLKLD